MMIGIVYQQYNVTSSADASSEIALTIDNFRKRKVQPMVTT